MMPRFLQFYWGMVDLQCCVNLCCAAKWFSDAYTHILFCILFNYGLSQDMEYSSLCYAVDLIVYTLYIIVCFCSSQLPGPPSSTPPPGLYQPQVCSLVCVSASGFVHLFCVLDFTCTWYHWYLSFSFWPSPPSMTASGSSTLLQLALFNSTFMGE